MIKNIVFDMGNVLILFDPDFFIKRIGIEDKKSVEILKREIYGSIEWSMTDRGTLTEKQACEIIEKRVPDYLKDSVAKLTSEWHRPIVPILGAKELIKELKENGYSIYLLSNASLNLVNYWHDIPGSEYFDGEIISSYVKYLKPQMEIYQCLIDKYGLKKEECVFIDDSALNAEGAVNFGMLGIVFHNDYNEVRRKLIEYGVNVKEH